MKNAAQFEMCRTFAISCQIKNFRFTLSLRGGQQAMMMRVSPRIRQHARGYMDHIRLSWRPKV